MIERTTILHVTIINHSDSPKLDNPTDIMQDVMDFLLEEYYSAKVQLITTATRVIDREE